MIHMISVKYAFSLSSVFCSDRDSATSSDASVLAVGPRAGPAATDWHCRATAAWGLLTYDLGEVMPSNRQ